MTYLPAQVMGRWFYLYLILDLYSRKIVGWEVHDADHSDHAHQKRRLARRSVVNLKSLDCHQCHFLHRIPSYSRDCLSGHMTNESLMLYSVISEQGIKCDLSGISVIVWENWYLADT